MGRSPCCDKNGLKKGPWTAEEDTKLIQYIQMHGPGNWRTLPKNAGLKRCGKSCRLRWTNYLRPDIKRGRFSFEEEETIIQLHSVLGNKWSAIAARLPGRTDNEIKNYWNTHIRKRLLRMGIDPVTHAPRLDLLDLSSLLNSPHLNLSNLLRLQTLLNPESLRLAISLVSSNIDQNPDILLQKLQENNQFLNNTPNDNHQLENPLNISQNQQIQSNFATCSYPNPTEDTNMQNMGYFSNNQMFMQDNFAPNTVGMQNLGYGGQMINNDLSEMNTTTSSSNNSQCFGFDSVLSSPAPPNSASTFTEDERDISFCSNLLRFEVPEGLDLDDFM